MIASLAASIPRHSLDRLSLWKLKAELHAIELADAAKYALAGAIRPNKFTIVAANGHRMLVYLRDQGISRDLYLYRERERYAMRYFRSFLEPDDVVLDAGANIGYYTLAAHEVASRGAVFATEPVPFNRALLETNLTMNDATRVHVFPFAFGEASKGAEEFYVYDRINWASFNKSITGGNILETIAVETLTIDDFVELHMEGKLPTVLRMDIEGYELQVIRGALRTLACSSRMKIFMEMHPHLLPPASIAEILDNLRSAGFEVRAIVNECEPSRYRFVNKGWNLIEKLPLGIVGSGYDTLRECLEMHRGSEVFFEKC